MLHAVLVGGQVDLCIDGTVRVVYSREIGPARYRPVLQFVEVTESRLAVADSPNSV